MEDLRPVSGQPHQLAAAFLVERAVLVQEAENQAVRPVCQKLLGVRQGRGVFCLRIAEAALARAHHRHDRKVNHPFCDQQLSHRGRQPSVKEAGVELHAIRAAAGSGQDVLHAPAADLQGDVLFHL